MKVQTPGNSAITQLGRGLLEEHGQLDVLLERMLNASDGIDSTVLQCIWTEFENRLTRHLEFEETHVFPRAEKQQPATVAHLCQEHAEIRNLMATLGVSADLHTLRRPAAEELARLLRAHASYEARTLYPLAGDQLAHVEGLGVQ